MSENGRAPLSLPQEFPAAGDPQELRGALHDVANALTVVLGWLEHAESEGAGESPAAEALVKARRWARHGKEIALRAIGGARSMGYVGPDDVVSLLRDALAAAAPQAAQREVRLITEASADAASLRLQAWPAALQALTNLLLNAVAFTPPSTSVRVSARTSELSAVLVVSDEGPGIDPLLREGLFEGGPSSRPGGNGIGLRHSRGLAARHGGSLELVESEAGARFELRWPLAQECDCEAVPGQDSASLRGRKVLVFDDDDAVLSLLQLGLEARGAQVVTTRHTEGVRDALSEGEYDAALIDLSPLGDGAERVLCAMRREYPGMRVVLISGAAVLPPGGAMACANAWIRKPFEVQEVVDAVAGEGR